MPRLREVPRAEAPSPFVVTMYDFIFGPDRDPAVDHGTETGSPGDWWTVFANSADVFEHAVAGFALYQSPKRKLPPVLRELAQTRTGWAAGAKFVYSQHCKSLRGLGVSEEKIAAVPNWAAAAYFDETERIVLGYTDCLVYDHGRVPDALFDAMKRVLDDEQILELTYITALYLAHAVMSRALRTEFDDVPEPVSEVPAPEGKDNVLRIARPDAEGQDGRAR
jgi:alkylhydroperoxidase family enzyme